MDVQVGFANMSSCMFHMHTLRDQSAFALHPSSLPSADGVYGAVLCRRSTSSEPSVHLVQWDVGRSSHTLTFWVILRGCNASNVT